MKPAQLPDNNPVAVLAQLETTDKTGNNLSVLAANYSNQGSELKNIFEINVKGGTKGTKALGETDDMLFSCTTAAVQYSFNYTSLRQSKRMQCGETS